MDSIFRKIESFKIQMFDSNILPKKKYNFNWIISVSDVEPVIKEKFKIELVTKQRRETLFVLWNSKFMLFFFKNDCVDEIISNKQINMKKLIFKMENKLNSSTNLIRWIHIPMNMQC